MDNQALKAYVKKVAELEILLYNLEKAKPELLKAVEARRVTETRPAIPLKPLPKVPVAPERVDGDVVISTIMLIVDSLLASFCLLGVIVCIGAPTCWIYVPGLILFVCAVVKRAKDLKYWKDYRRAEKEEYKRDCEAYETLETVRAENEEIRRRNEEIERQNRAALQRIDSEHTALAAKLDAEIRQASSLLERYYGLDVIYPKYRNLVAVATFCEYLSSGLCSALEGFGGAYSTYENELRQNIIIGQLSAVLSNLEKIREGQYYLYRELTAAGEEIARAVKASDATGYLVGIDQRLEEISSLLSDFSDD